MNKNNEHGAQEITFLLPDISGFTRFLKNTEIGHSRHIIEELIGLIVLHTKEHFKIAEVEGDALFLYQESSKIDATTIFDIAQKTFIAFHKHLRNYNHLRICNCGACVSSVNLTMKFIAHTGNVEFVKVNGKSKPYGLDVIKVHRLLKNKIEGKEYVLFSDDFKKKHPVDLINNELIHGSSTYEEIGEIKYSHIELGHLRKGIKADVENNQQTGSRLKTLISKTIEIDAPVNVVYEVLSDFKYRPLWHKDAKVVDHDENEIYKVGTEHYCIINNKKVKVKTIGNKSSKFEFGEQVLKTGPFRELNLYFIFDSVEGNAEKTQLSIEIRAKIYSLLKPFVLLLVKSSLQKKIPEMMEDIKKVSENEYKERNIREVNLVQSAS